MRARVLYYAVAVLLLAGWEPALAQPPGHGQPPGKQKHFPDYAETEYEQSVITIPIYLPGQKEPAEILKLDAFMRLERERPSRNGLGHRQFEFTIADWEVYGYSKVLDGHISLTLSNTKQPKSLGVSLQQESDYPAILVYNAIYDIYLDGKRIAADRPGVAFAKNVFEIPPRNITVAFEKPFESPELTFSSGTCEDMVGIDRATYKQGREKGPAIRAGKHSLKPKGPKGGRADSR